jgi:hypothetical protein
MLVAVLAFNACLFYKFWSYGKIETPANPTLQ